MQNNIFIKIKIKIGRLENLSQQLKKHNKNIRKPRLNVYFRRKIMKLKVFS